MIRIGASDEQSQFWRSRRNIYHRAVPGGTSCGAGTRDMSTASLMLGGIACRKCFPNGVSAS